MNQKPGLRAHIDAEGRLVLPAETAARYGLQPGTEVWIEDEANGLHLRRPVTHLAKVYVEPTNHCNLDCVTCVRNAWDEPLGRMSTATFERVSAGLRACSPVPTVFFGGFGEPLAHAGIVAMVTQAKELGAQVELITNGTLLTEKMSRQLIEAGLDVLWVSLDGATPECYADVRLGATLPQVLENVTRFRELRPSSYYPKPEIGVAFVAMKRNIDELPEMLATARWLGAAHFKVSNVLPYTAELCADMLYEHTLSRTTFQPSPGVPHLSLPRIDISKDTGRSLFRAINSNRTVSYAGRALDEANERCPFVESGVAAISWDGSLSPCLPLLHSHVSYVGKYRHAVRRHVIGNINAHSLHELWHLPEYVAFREKVQAFDFPPCTACGGCMLLEANETDCFGNAFPTCGGCLWAQGVIQCP